MFQPDSKLELVMKKFKKIFNEINVINKIGSIDSNYIL